MAVVTLCKRERVSCAFTTASSNGGCCWCQLNIDRSTATVRLTIALLVVQFDKRKSGEKGCESRIAPPLPVLSLTINIRSATWERFLP